MVPLRIVDQHLHSSCHLQKALVNAEEGEDFDDQARLAVMLGLEVMICPHRPKLAAEERRA